MWQLWAWFWTHLCANGISGWPRTLWKMICSSEFSCKIGFEISYFTCFFCFFCYLSTWSKRNSSGCCTASFANTFWAISSSTWAHSYLSWILGSDCVGIFLISITLSADLRACSWCYFRFIPTMCTAWSVQDFLKPFSAIYISDSTLRASPLISKWISYLDRCKN